MDAEEIQQLFKMLNHRSKRVEIEDMIWEVDEDCDKAVNWEEFQAMYHRCRNDKTGFEPRRLYHVVEFIMNDKDGSGAVSVEEAMHILYIRYGREKMDGMLMEIFGTSDIHSGKELTLTEFLGALHTQQIKHLKDKPVARGIRGVKK